MNIRNIFFVLIISNCLYSQTTDTLSFIHDDKRVFGTLRIPAGPGTHPLLILDPGSGANDRDGTINMIGGNIPCLYPGLLFKTLKPYKELAQILSDAGYAVYTYDKIEYTYSSNPGIISFHKIWLPVESAIPVLKKRYGIDSAKIILIGHSEGSSLIPYIAKKRSDIKALISIAGPRTPLDSIINNQYLYISRKCMLDTNSYKYQGQQVLSYFDIIRRHAWNTSTPSFAGADPQTWFDYINVVDSVAINYNLNKIPTLFIGLGTEDINVPPGELDRFQSEVTTSSDFWRMSDIVHYMTPPDDPHISKTLTDTIIYWLNRVCPVVTASEQIKLELGIRVFPNPANYELFIQNTLNEFKDKIHLKIFNANGNLAKDLELSSSNESIKIPIQNWPQGIYFVHLNDNKSMSRILKFLKL